MEALCNSRTKNCSYTGYSGDRNFIDMKLGNLVYEVSAGNSASIANSLNGMELNTSQPESLTSDQDTLSSASSLLSSYTSDASYFSQDSGIGRTVPDDLQISLKRQGLTVDDLSESAPPFVVEWQSVRDVFQCLNCASPIDFLSRKVLNIFTIVKISNHRFSALLFRQTVKFTISNTAFHHLKWTGIIENSTGKRKKKSNADPFIQRSKGKTICV